MNFNEFLKTNKNSRKIFGRKELEIIFKQLDGIALKQSEKNRLSRDIKPKLEFIKEANEFREEFKLEKNQENKKAIKGVVRLILQDRLKEKIRAILLFGSHVKGQLTHRSDIDIGVVFSSISREDAERFRMRILGHFPLKMDVQVFNILPQKIKRDICRNHRVLYGDKGYDNIDFSIRYLKDEDYFIRKRNIFGAGV